MFSFHKPKIYRSNLGCCICKAKSSSSRFTDSNKYENEFERCFRIQEKRSGEICNACVLLVKRWKKLSPENRLIKHWHHVVDARAGPGTKLTSGRRLTSSLSSSSSSSLSNQKEKSELRQQHQDDHQHYHHQQQTKSLAGQQQSQQNTFSTSSQNSTSQPHNNNNNNNNNNNHHHHLLPLSSNQNNHTGNGSGSATGNGNTTSGQQQQGLRRRGGSLSGNKARAIDTNVSIFNSFGLGEGNKPRSYMTPEGFSVSASAALNKPQSALNSSAFESVIKRFRQRQQQQLVELQRRKLQRQQRLQRLAASNQPCSSASSNNNNQPSRKLSAKQLPIQEELEKVGNCTNLKTSSTTTTTTCNAGTLDKQQQQQVACKRVKRSSESIGSICVDGLRVSSLLDSSLWRKEKVCCGIIFRGIHNEVAIFPKLLKPCPCRLQRRSLAAKAANSVPATTPGAAAAAAQAFHDDNNEAALLTSPGSSPTSSSSSLTLAKTHIKRERNVKSRRSLSPRPRAQKSGSISSCDSNTSGTGSFEEPTNFDDLERASSKQSTSGQDEEVSSSSPTSSSNYQDEQSQLKFIYI